MKKRILSVFVAVFVGLTGILMKPHMVSANSNETNNQTFRPIASPSSLVFETSQTITLSTETEGAMIFYTLDGTIPAPSTPSSLLYTEPFTVTETTAVRAIAIKDGMINSDVLTVTFIKRTDEAHILHKLSSEEEYLINILSQAGENDLIPVWIFRCEIRGGEVDFIVKYVLPSRKIIHISQYTGTRIVEATPAEIIMYAILYEVVGVSFFHNTPANPGSGGGGGGGGGGSTTPPVDTTTTPLTPTITAGTATWNVTNIPRTALTALGLSIEIPVNQIRIPTGAIDSVFVNVGVAFAEQNAVLVQYNADTEKLEFVSAVTVGANGNANINITQAGDFLVLTFKTGDVTGTGEVTTSDALELLRSIAGITELNSIQLFVANGKIDEVSTNDALSILRIVAGL
ncbi:MAG: chitobiase/beta-hexosaminidase C-terminal domain-containing protein [Oscillospiraceae bacterium]|jgi:hypothetical protein|nr:chitobiase/beta-hexosaminidase C-terminal domain-containing protein [Oscillospiraceae bacterium]